MKKRARLFRGYPIDLFCNALIRRWGILALSVLVLLIWAGCEHPFDSKGPYDKRLVVYSILSNRSDSQYVRVYSTYNPPAYNPLDVSSDTYVQNARVSIANDSASYNLVNTVIPRSDRSRYSTDIPAYVGYPIRVQFGKTYSLGVRSPDGNATASVTTPGVGLVEAYNPQELKAPLKYTDDIAARVKLSPGAAGYIVRLFIDFDVTSTQGVIHTRVEVPNAVVPIGTADTSFQYPTLVRRSSDPFIVFEAAIFSLDGYKVFLNDLIAQTGPIHLTSATFILTQVEDNLYKYFNIVNGFQDQFSIRTDQPDYSNIVGGFGVFGAMRDDSVLTDLR
jgi:hypothetical protein